MCDIDKMVGGRPAWVRIESVAVELVVTLIKAILMLFLELGLKLKRLLSLSLRGSLVTSCDLILSKTKGCPY